jgi:hypothetical protein
MLAVSTFLEISHLLLPTLMDRRREEKKLYPLNLERKVGAVVGTDSPDSPPAPLFQHFSTLSLSLRSPHFITQRGVKLCRIHT